MNSLKNFLGSNNPISVYDDTNDTEKFMIGFLIGLTEQHALFNAITTRGFEDGYYLTLIEDIYRVDGGGGKYQNKILALWNNLKQVKANNIEIKDNLVNDLLSYSKDEKLPISIYIFNDDNTDITGFVNAFDNDIVTIDLIDNYGNEDGISIVDISRISRICCDSGYERNLRNR